MSLENKKTGRQSHCFVFFISGCRALRPFEITMSQVRVYSLIGDANVRGYINKTTCRANPSIGAAQLLSCCQLEIFPDSLKEVRSQSTVCIIGCLTNFITSCEGPSSITQRVQPLLQDFRDAVVASCEANPSREYLIAPPMYRSRPVWYREGLPEILSMFSQHLSRDVPPTLRILPSFSTPEYQNDGVSLTSYAGLEYVLHLFDSTQDLLDRSKEPVEVSSRISEATRVLEDRVMVLEQDHRRLNQVVEHKIAIDSELADFRQNERFEISFVIAGLPVIPDELVGKEWQRRAVSDVQVVIKKLMGSERPIHFVQNSTKRFTGAEVTYTVQMVELSDSKAIRRKFGSFFLGGRTGLPEELTGISIKNRVTPETLTRISVMKLLAKRYKDANPGSLVKVIGYDPRPMLKIVPASSASDRRVKNFNYIQAVTKLPINFPESEFEPILRRINPELSGKIRSLFIILSDDAFRKIIRSRQKQATDAPSGSRASVTSESSEVSQATGANEASGISAPSEANGTRKRGPPSPASGSAAKK